ncbi:MAG: DNA polymerase ligase N-terminal domain-containing protein [Acidobacteriota bacterium]
MVSRFVIHRHRTGRTHFDLRIIYNGILRSWSMLREPPQNRGEKRLAIERESFTAVSINSRTFEEEAFGIGKVQAWDTGDVDISEISPQHLSLTFRGSRLLGDFEIRKTRWYPGNRWLFTKTGSTSISHKGQ